MNERALVSVIVPVYNAEKFIPAFIKSILDQTYESWELIIVDDGSTDDTMRVAKLEAQKDGRIRLLQRNRLPKGSVTSRNIGQQAAQGEYIIHFDVDDIVLPIALEQRVLYMESHPDVAYATFRGQSFYIDKEGNVVRDPRMWGRAPEKMDSVEAFLRAIYPFSVWNNIYRSNLFKSYLWDENVRIYTDFSYIIPVLLKGFTHCYVENSEIDYLYRVNQSAGAMTSNFIADEKFESTLYLFRKTMSLIDNHPNKVKLKRFFKDYYLLQMERVFISGTNSQIDDFIFFISEYYRLNVRLKISKWVLSLLNSIIKDKKRTLTRFVMYSLFSPSKICEWLTDKL